MKKFNLKDMKNIKDCEIPNYKKIIREKTERIRPHYPLLSSLNDPINIIAEIKKSSPSAGPRMGGISPAERASLYAQGGAAAVSVLTEQAFFSGSIRDMEEAGSNLTLPLLCKDFIYYEEQIEAAYLCGADMILLIAKALRSDEMTSLHNTALKRGLTPLIEVHSVSELDGALIFDPEILMVNMRDLETLNIDYATGINTLNNIPHGIKRVSASGIETSEGLKKIFHETGTDTFLVGTALMRGGDPQGFIRELKDVR